MTMQGLLVILTVIALVSTVPVQQQEDAESYKPHRRGESEAFTIQDSLDQCPFPINTNQC